MEDDLIDGMPGCRHHARLVGPDGHRVGPRLTHRGGPRRAPHQVLVEGQRQLVSEQASGQCRRHDVDARGHERRGVAGMVFVVMGHEGSPQASSLDQLEHLARRGRHSGVHQGVAHRVAEDRHQLAAEVAPGETNADGARHQAFDIGFVFYLALRADAAHEALGHDGDGG